VSARALSLRHSAATFWAGSQSPLACPACSDPHLLVFRSDSGSSSNLRKRRPAFRTPLVRNDSTGDTTWTVLLLSDLEPQAILRRRRWRNRTATFADRSLMRRHRPSCSKPTWRPESVPLIDRRASTSAVGTGL
jgi:hypothetical protein